MSTNRQCVIALGLSVGLVASASLAQDLEFSWRRQLSFHRVMGANIIDGTCEVDTGDPCVFTDVGSMCVFPAPQCEWIRNQARSGDVVYATDSPDGGGSPWSFIAHNSNSGHFHFNVVPAAAWNDNDCDATGADTTACGLASLDIGVTVEWGRPAGESQHGYTISPSGTPFNYVGDLLSEAKFLPAAQGQPATISAYSFEEADNSSWSPSGWALGGGDGFNRYEKEVTDTVSITVSGPYADAISTDARSESGAAALDASSCGWQSGQVTCPPVPTESVKADVGGSSPMSESPVDLASGNKQESATDLVVPITGDDFVISRVYNSDPNYTAPALLGNKWTMSCFAFAQEASGTLTAGGMARGSVDIDVSGTGPEYPLPGSTSQYAVKTVIEVPGVHGTLDVPVWQIVEPGVREWNFYRENDSGEMTGDYYSVVSERVGLLLESRDPYGNKQTYYYTIFGATNGNARLVQVRLNRPDAPPTSVEDARHEADVRFIWDTTSGRLTNIEVCRPLYNGFVVQEVVTQRAEYTYFDGGTNHDENVGGSGDLVQVMTEFRVDPGSGETAATWREVFTQYRYHNETTDTASEYDFVGDDGQLKMLIRGEQIEYYAEEQDEDSLQAAAGALLNSSDSVVEEYASKMVEEYDDTTGQVKIQWVLSACGCAGGGTQGVRLSYDYFDHDDPADGTDTIKVIEEVRDGSVSQLDPYRTTYYEMYTPTSSGVPFLRSRAIVDDANATGTWITFFDHDSSGNLTAVYTPAALDAGEYAAGTNNDSPEYGVGNDEDDDPVSPFLEDSGLIRVYEYTSDNRRSKISVRDGGLGSDVLVSETIYGDADTTDDDRAYLPNEVRRYRTDSSSPTAAEIEVVTFEYGFHTTGGHDVAYVKRSEEAEASGELGPGGTYSSYELFDTFGNGYCSIAADGSIDYRQFDTYSRSADQPSGGVISRTGQVVQVIGNADPSAVPSVPGITMSNFGRFNESQLSTQGGSLTTLVVRDPLGRVKEVVSPSGLSTRFRTEIRGSCPGRPNHEEYLATVVLPVQFDTDEHDGPAVVQWFNADGDLIAEVHYPPSAAYTLASETAFASYPIFVEDYSFGAAVFQVEIEHDVAGLVEHTRRYHDVGSSAYYEDTYTYDQLGRLETAENDEGTIVRYGYDVLHRVIQKEIGTDTDPSTGDMEVVLDVYFDGSASAQGIGNGNVTRVVEHVDAGNRITDYEYDFRDRLIIIDNPEQPDVLMAYDNLSRVTQTGVFSVLPTASHDFNSSDSTRYVYTETAFSQRGLPYSTRRSIDPAAATHEFLETRHWFDEVGRIVGTWAPNSPVMKTQYDGLGRPTIEYVTDGGDASDATYSDFYSSPTTVVSNDVVLEQQEYRYVLGDDEPTTQAGLMDLVTTRLRTHDASGTALGALSPTTSPLAVSTYSGRYFDGADRVTRMIEFGTNTTGFVAANSVPTNFDLDWDSSGDQLVTEIVYGDRGLVETVVTPGGGSAGTAAQVIKRLYDDLYRQIATIENYEDAVLAKHSTEPRWSVTSGLDVNEPDTDRVISTYLNSAGQVTAHTVHLPDGTASEFVQNTTYIYTSNKGASSGQSEIASNNLLTEIRFPDETTGASSSAAAYTKKMAYNTLGELVFMEDQNQTEHKYHRDDLGRITLDEVLDAPNVDDAIEGIETEYTAFGTIDSVSSLSDVSMGTIANEVAFTYTGLLQIETFAQSHSGAVDSSTPIIRYVYEEEVPGASTPVGNYSRAYELEYPHVTTAGFTLEIKRSGLNSLISRIGGLDESDVAGTPPSIVEYEYLGLGQPVTVDYMTPGVVLDRFRAFDGDDTPGTYPGWDRFGRLINQMWVDVTFGPGGTAGIPNGPPIVHSEYSYDKDTNRTADYNVLPGTQWDNGREYSYDSLDRLEGAQFGVGDASSFSGTSSPEWAWDLDMANRWAGVSLDIDNDGSYTGAGEFDQSPTHNEANELTDRGGLAFAYDAAGNLTDEETSTGGSEFLYVHDAWNRLVSIEGVPSGGSSNGNIAEYEYNGLHHRILVRSDVSLPLTGPVDEARQLFYSPDWQLIEERIDDTYTGTFAADRIIQTVWGVIGIDNALVRRLDDDVDGTIEERHWLLCDAIGSVVAVVDSNARVLERVVYSPYGEARHHQGHDVDGDGDVDTADTAIITAISLSAAPSIGGANYRAEADINRDGVVDSNDSVGPNARALADGLISDIDNVVGFAGYLFNSPGQQYTVRYRHYLPRHGRWVERDPLGFIDGGNVYQYSASSPVDLVDSFGLFWGKNTDYDPILFAQQQRDFALRAQWKAGVINDKQYSALLRVSGHHHRGEIYAALAHKYGEEVGRWRGVKNIGLGGVEMAGGAFSSPFLGGVGGLVLIVHGADTAFSGIRSLIDGAEHRTFTATCVTDVTGSEAVGDWADIALSTIDLPVAIWRLATREAGEHVLRAAMRNRASAGSCSSGGRGIPGVPLARHARTGDEFLAGDEFLRATDMVPNAWIERANRKGVGRRWQDPSDVGNNIRIDMGIPNSPWPSQRVDHVVVSSRGKLIGRDGQPLSGALSDNAVQAHIPLSEYVNWSSWNAP